MEPGYLLFGTGNDFRKYQDWCRLQHQPQIRAQKLGQQARVEMDLIWYDHDTHDREKTASNELFLIKIRQVHDQVRSRRSVESRGVYTSLSHLAPHYAEFVAQAYLAIFRQTIGQTATAPAFPEPEPENKHIMKMRQARERRYMKTHTVQEGIFSLRWQEFCRAYHWPYLSIHEARRDKAQLEIRLPEGSFSPEIQSGILQAGAAIGLKNGPPRSTRGRNWYQFSGTSFTTTQTIPTDSALLLAEAAVQLLEGQAHFPPIDESWHA